MAAIIPRGSDYFFPTLYEGNGKGQRIGKFVPFTDNGTIAKSCIFERGDSPRLNRSASGTGTSRRKYTLSVWAKPSVSSSASDERYVIVAGPYGNSDGITFDDDRTLKFWLNGRTSGDFKTNRTFEDSSKFYHILVAVDTTQSTASDRVKIYVDGDQQTSFSLETYPSQDYDGNWGTTASTNIGSSNSPNRYYNGYLAEVNYVDGTAYGPDTFGLTDTSTGRWIPKSLTGISYGTNGFRLEFANSAGQTIGDDTSGNGNDLTVTNLAAGDITTDSPTQNHATLEGTGGTLSQGNLKLVTGNSDFSHHNATLKPTSGKYYAEFTCDVASRAELGVASTLLLPYGSNTTRLPEPPDGSLAGYMYYGYHGRVYYNSSNGYDVTYATYTTNDIIGIALDLDNLTVQFFKNNTSQGTLSLPNSNYTFVVGDGATGYNGGWTANFGQKSFTYTPPSGFSALQQDNLPTNDKNIPDLVWIKNRDASDNHQLYDSSRGVNAVLNIEAGAETTVTDGLQKFLKGGFAIEDDVSVNTNAESYVAWKWVANGGTTAANTDGSGASIASTTQANETAGFSIVTYTGTGSAGTIAHGLSSAPEWVMASRRNDNSGDGWTIYHKGMTDANYWMDMRTTNAQNSASIVWNGTAPTNKVFSVGTSTGTNTSTKTYVAYCWHSVEGFSRFGTYTGNASTDGTFVYTGFLPAWVMIKCFSTSGNGWTIHDNKRMPFNGSSTETTLYADASQAEQTSGGNLIDFLSNGFKLRGTNTNLNGTRNYLYMAFAEHPFHGADGITVATAR